RLLSADGGAYVRRRVAEELRDYSKKLDEELRERRERLRRTEEKMAGLVDFIARGARGQALRVPFVSFTRLPITAQRWMCLAGNAIAASRKEWGRTPFRGSERLPAVSSPRRAAR